MTEIYDKNFDEEVLKKTISLVLVDFSAAWCQPCKMMEPVLRNLEEKFKDTLIVYKYDVEKGHNVAGNYGVTSLPTLILFEGGKVLWVQTGLISQAKLEDKFKEYLPFL